MSRFESLNTSQRTIMGIVNCTPDSFYTGVGQMPTAEELRAQLSQHLLAGVGIIDVGGCSTRRGADEVSLEEEWQRVELGLRTATELFRECGRYPMLSVDTFHSEVARRAIEGYGVEMINDVTGGLFDEQMYSLVAAKRVRYVAMHMRGTPKTMMTLTDYDDVVVDVAAALQERVEQMHAAGIEDQQIVLDPGFGFAKTLEQEYRLLDGLDRIAALGYPLLVGISRKSMITRALQVDKSEALPATTALHWELLRKGVTILRVHDAAEAQQVLAMYNFYEEQIRKR